MVRIELLDASSSSTVLDSARDLFRAYGEFLRGSGGHQNFDFERLRREALDLPGVYVRDNGGVLVALTDEAAIGCVAFRALPEGEVQDRCEIKRLFVISEYRGSGIGLQLVSAALEHARTRGYRFAYLDTEPATMPAAHRMYLKLGFVEYERKGALSLLRRALGAGEA